MATAEHPKTERSVSHTRTIAAPASTIFNYLAAPAQHHLFDGSDTVVAAQQGCPERLALGTKFSMDMHMFVGYRMKNTVVEFEENRRIAWTHVGGHIWRYELNPIDEQHTDVTESFDWDDAVIPSLYPLIGAPARNLSSIVATLDRLAAQVETP